MSVFPDGYRYRVLSSVDSTLDEAKRLLPEVSGPEWILALEQRAARGRRGRAWSMPPGNFAATLILPIKDMQAGAMRSFVAALALREACVGLSGLESAFALKWPNDVLCKGGKLAGILLEQLGPGHLGIGIGVNLVAAPDPSDLNAGAVLPTTLRAVGVETHPEAFLPHLAHAFARHETQMQSFGFQPIRQAWLSHAAKLGEAITARTTRETHQGTFQDVDAMGQLVLETPQGRLSIPAADVYF